MKLNLGGVSVKAIKKLTVGMLVFLFIFTPLLEVFAADDSQIENGGNDAALEASDNDIAVAGDNISESAEEENLSEDSSEEIGLLLDENQDADYDEEQKITGNKPFVDKDSNTGDLLYNYPLNLPPGRNGTQPNLALKYNNQDKEIQNIFGYGWSINIPYIERINRKGVENLYSENYYYSSLSGELNKITSSGSGGEGESMSAPLDNPDADLKINKSSSINSDTQALIDRGGAYLAADGSVLINNPQELVSQRTRNSKTYFIGYSKENKKINKARFYSGEIHYFNKSTSQYEDIDTNVVNNIDGWNMSEAAYYAKLRQTANGDFITFINQGQELYFSLLNQPESADNGQKTTSGEWANKQIIYSDALNKNVDISVKLNNEALIKEAVINNLEALGDLTGKDFYEIPFKLTSNKTIDIKSGDKLLSKEGVITTDQMVEVVDDSGIVSYIWPPKAVDAANNIISIQIEYKQTEDGIILTKKIPAEWLKTAKYPVRTDATVSYYAGAGDGRVRSIQSTWDAAHDAAAGSQARYDVTEESMYIGRWDNYIIDRLFFPIDTSGLPDSATISSSSLNLYIISTTNNDNDGEDYVTVVETNQADTSSLAIGDYDECGESAANGWSSAHYSDIIEGVDSGQRKDISNIPASAWQNFTLNATGRDWISKTGYTKIGVREGHDMLDHAIALNNYEANQINFRTSDYTGTSSDPYLEIEYTEYNALQNLFYAYDKVGNITQIEDASDLNSAKTTAYQYDDLYRLTRASSTNAIYGGDYLETYSYNAIGNIMNKSDQGNYGYEGNTGTRFENPHAATSIGGASYAYDNNGNLTSDGVWTHIWDYDNRLIQSTNGTTTIGYTYDQDGNRLTYSDGIATTTYINKFFSVSTTGTTTKNIYLGDQLIATVEGNGIATSTYYVHTDHLSGSNVITDENGHIVQLLDYYPFGGTRIDGKTGSYDNPKKYDGYTRDADSGLDYAGARYYNSSIGRWTNQDPLFLDIGSSDELYGRSLAEILASPQGMNSYSYVINNPLLYRDPYGIDAVIFYGGNKSDPNFFREIAYQNAQKMIESGYKEPVYVKEGSSPQQWNSALSSVNNIDYIGYYGHGGTGALYLSNTTNSKGKQGTVSIINDKNNPTYDPKTDITVDSLNNKNVKKNVKIELYSCNAGVGGSKSITQAFASRFNGEAKGARAKINFDSQGQPYVSHFFYNSPSYLFEKYILKTGPNLWALYWK